ncbi:CPBP family intramembrane glutamic endopeptidase [Collimonas sp.]|jgi:membrane protease YdiL (CAAX protease family)|uniref:CPBP family intramembrane glutamic endopeptidase n=1 Tax=Collimonas sp. TaxID=1963772 RepID=UPI002C94AC81|nr:CPBP family intramembrane glutamic endopeptidase [Collimonas sp.]HWW05730.1 CPBP family intramembrane glutamic endopeptidase [Collimonas sp.]
MTDTTAPTPGRPLFQLSGFRFRSWSTIWPILLAAILMQLMLWPAREAARWLFKHQAGWFHHQVWAFVGLAELFQLAAGLAAILIMRRLLPQADPHLRWPPQRSYAGLALLIGVGMALVMLLADYWPQLLSRTPPQGGYEMTPIGIPGWLAVMFAAGPNEEIIFRGVLVGMLTVLVPGRVRLERFEVPLSGVIVGLLFGAAHYQSFFNDPLYQAVAQQLYAFVFGLIYVWLMERSRSLLAPMIAHGAGDLLEVAAVMLLSVAWA